MTKAADIMAAATPGPWAAYGATVWRGPRDRIREADELDARAIVTAVNLFPLYEAVREAGSREHRWIEGVDADGDDWLGCICGERDGCDTLHALVALQAAEDAL